jgi:hypothetical protein
MLNLTFHTQSWKISGDGQAKQFMVRFKKWHRLRRVDFLSVWAHPINLGILSPIWIIVVRNQNVFATSICLTSLTIACDLRSAAKHRRPHHIVRSAAIRIYFHPLGLEGVEVSLASCFLSFRFLIFEVLLSRKEIRENNC